MYIPHAVPDSSSTVLAQTWTRAALRVLVSMVYHPLGVAHARGGQRGSCHCSLVASIADPFPRFFASLSPCSVAQSTQCLRSDLVLQYTPTWDYIQGIASNRC
jgi:hypothetical protein